MIRPKWTYRIVKGQEGTITPNESEKITAPRNTTRVAEVPKQRIKVDPIDIPMGDWEWPESGNTIADPNNDQYVSEFFEYDVLPRYMREHPNATKEEIEAVKKAYSYPQYMSDLNNGTGGWTVHGDGETHIDYNKNYKLSRPVMVHENTHAYRLNGASYTPEEKELLLNAYDVSGSTEYPIDESGATNSEVRYRLWKELYDNLGRRPSLEELDAYIQNYDKYKLIDGVEGANDYGWKAIRNLQHKRYPEDDWDFVGPRREDAGSNMPDEYFWNGYRMFDENVNNIRNALIHVADNNVEEPQIEGNQLARWGGVIKAKGGVGKAASKIIKNMAKEVSGAKKPTGVFANMRSSSEASKALTGIGKASNVGKRPRIAVAPKKEYALTYNSNWNAAQNLQNTIEQTQFEIEQAKRGLKQYWQRLYDEQGIETPAWIKKASFKVVESHPKAVSAPPEGEFAPVYQSFYKDRQPIMFEGETLKDWMDAAGDYYKFGPHSEILQVVKPFQSALNYYNTVGEVVNTKPLTKREPLNKASDINMAMLRDGMGKLRDWWFEGTSVPKTRESLPVIPKVKPVESIATTPATSDIMKTKDKRGGKI